MLPISQYRDRLHSKLATLGVTNYREALWAVATADPMDVTQTLSDRELAIHHTTTEARRVREIHAALQRIRVGEFGVCIDCEEPIAARRLDAVPEAARCVKCQERWEATQDGEGDEESLDTDFFAA